MPNNSDKGHPSGERGPPDDRGNRRNSGRGPGHGRGNGRGSGDHPVFVDGDRFPGNAARDFLRDRKNVIGHGIGLQERDGEITEEKGVTVYVSQKEDDDNLSEDERVPDEIEGQPTDVIEIPHHQRNQQIKGNRNEEFQPVMGGLEFGLTYASTGNTNGATLAGWFYDVDAAQPVMLGAKHVLYPSTSDSPSTEMGTDVSQPTASDRVFGQISDASDGANADWADCAYIAPASGETPTTRMFGMGEIVDIHSPELGTYYVQNGYRCGSIGGRCVAVDVTRTASTAYDERGQFLFDAHGAPGDSGAAIGFVDSSGDFHAVGMHLTSWGNRAMGVSFDQVNADPSLNTIEPLIDHQPSNNAYPSIGSANNDQSYIETGLRHIDYDPSTNELTLSLHTANLGNQSGSTNYRLESVSTGTSIYTDSVTLNSGEWTHDTVTVSGDLQGEFHDIRTDDMVTAYSNDSAIGATQTVSPMHPGSELHVVAHTVTGTLTDQNQTGIGGAKVVAVREGQRIEVTETASDGSFSLDLDDTDPAHVFFDTDLSNFTDPRVTFSYPDRTGGGA